MSLEQRQEELRQKNDAQVRRGRPLNEPAIPLERLMEANRRVFAYMELEAGVSAARVAAKFGFDLNALLDWYRGGKRL